MPGRLSRTLEAPAEKYYFSFRQGPIAFIVLDTGEDKDDTHPVYAGLGDFTAYRVEQRRWLERAVADPAWQSAPFRVLFTHIPLRLCPGGAVDPKMLYSEGSRAQWEPLLTNARIDFAFSGHTHHYFHSEPTAAQPWPLLVGGGPHPDKATYIHLEADGAEMQVRMFGLDARNLGQWRVTRRPAA